MDIQIRRAEPGDYEAVARNFEHEEAFAGTLQAPYPSRDAWRQRLESQAEGDFMLLALVDGQVVGNAGLHAAGKSPRRAHVRQLGLTVREDFHGRGVGTALMKALVDLADDWLNVFRLELTVYTDNERALALYRRFGFEIEGTHRAYALRAGRYVDSYAMARIKPKSSGV